MTATVFAGPTLAADEVRRLLPAAEVRGPVAVGDVLAIARLPRRKRPVRLAIIDGYFEGMAAVWHKEILVAIAAGIEVWGAASMGALRAAELARFGMVGVGAIYRDFVRGTLVADDEVAVAHLPAEYGYRAISDALVNLRHGIATAPMLGPRIQQTLVTLAQRRFYRERSWAMLVSDAAAAGVARRTLDQLAAWPKPDRKAIDARMLLRRLSRTPARRPAALAVPRTWALAQLERLVDERT